MKLASLVLVLGSALLVTSSGSAQVDNGYSSGPQPVYASPGGASATGARNGRGIKDNGPHQRPMMASAQLYTPWRFGFGVGLKLGFEIPLVHNGFIPSINNSFSIEPYFGLAWNNYNSGYGYGGGRFGGLGYYDDNLSAMEYTPGVSVLWSFYFSQNFRAYAAVHTGVTIVAPYYSGPGDYEYVGDNYVRFHFELAPGIVYSLTDKVALRAELGWWSGIKGGVAIFL